MLLTTHFDPSLVAVSVAVAVLASYTALNLAGSVSHAKGLKARWIWIIGGSLAMGIGIWSMHFIGMLAFSMPGMLMGYAPGLMTLSILVAIGASALALSVVSNSKDHEPSFLFAGVAMGIAIAGMHYLGMASMRMDARIEWNYWLVAFSVLIAIVASIGALSISFRLRNREDGGAQLRRTCGALAMGVAIAGMHYTGMLAAHFIHDPEQPEIGGSQGLIATSGLTTLVVTTTLIVLSMAIAGSIFDRALRRRISQAEEAKQALAALQEERNLRERFVSSLTHDLRTPLTAAKLNSELISRLLDRPKQLEEANTKLLDNLRRADEMIRDLLDAHRISAHQSLPLEIQPCDLGDLARRTIENLQLIHGERFELNVDGHVQGQWDPGYLRRVIENLCSNAVKYGRPGSIVRVFVGSRGEQTELIVQNQGELLSEIDICQLFQLFRRTRSAETSGIRGWGIGLTLVKGVVEGHGGRIAVTSNEAEGTIFRVLLPTNAGNPCARSGSSQA